MKRALVYVGLGVWFAAIVIAFGLLWRYKLTPGPLADAPARWPAESHLARTAAPTVVMFVHPQCSCSRASVNELARLVDELHGQATVELVLVRPAGAEPGFERGALADRAAELRGVSVIIDDGGREAERFGAIVSGSTLVYGANGALLFRGGLTTARGHEGRGPAHDAILAAIAGHPGAASDAPTFGCALAERDLQGAR